MKNINCPSCGAEISAKLKFCNLCGADLTHKSDGKPQVITNIPYAMENGIWDIVITKDKTWFMYVYGVNWVFKLVYILTIPLYLVRIGICFDYLISAILMIKFKKAINTDKNFDIEARYRNSKEDSFIIDNSEIKKVKFSKEKIIFLTKEKKYSFEFQTSIKRYFPQFKNYFEKANIKTNLDFENNKDYEIIDPYNRGKVQGITVFAAIFFTLVLPMFGWMIGFYMVKATDNKAQKILGWILMSWCILMSIGLLIAIISTT